MSLRMVMCVGMLCVCASASADPPEPQSLRFEPGVHYQHMVQAAFSSSFPIRLLLHDPLVLEDLRLSEAQVKQLAELDQQYVERMSEFRKAYTPERGKESELGARQRAMGAARTEMIQRSEEAAYNVLDVRQRHRLGQLCAQMAGANLLDIEAVQKELGISKSQLIAIRAKRKELFKRYEKSVTPANVEKMVLEEYVKLDLLEQLTFDECLRLLDPTQQEKLVAMRGETCMFRPPFLKRRISYGTAQKSTK